MTPEHQRQLIVHEMQRGDQALAAAEALDQAQLPYDAASRAYYAAFHYARALCLAAGQEARSHGGVAHLLSQHFVRTGALPADTSRLYAGLQRFRESADYDATFVLDARGAARALSAARTLIERARGWLQAQGMLEAAPVPEDSSAPPEQPADVEADTPPAEQQDSSPLESSQEGEE